MNAESMELAQEDLVERIADSLPDNLRADFYSEMRHCRSLPENDEMLRILRIMQFLTLLTESVPGQVVVERERLESLFAMGLHAFKKMIDSSETYHSTSASSGGNSRDRIRQADTSVRRKVKGGSWFSRRPKKSNCSKRRPSHCDLLSLSAFTRD